MNAHRFRETFYIHEEYDTLYLFCLRYTDWRLDTYLIIIVLIIRVYLPLELFRTQKQTSFVDLRGALAQWRFAIMFLAAD